MIPATAFVAIIFAKYGGELSASADRLARILGWAFMLTGLLAAFAVGRRW
jgi:hypothetical protein